MELGGAGSPNPIWSIRLEYLQTWKVMESMVAAGKTKAIGVSNFTVEQLEQVRDAPNPQPPIR